MKSFTKYNATFFALVFAIALSGCKKNDDFTNLDTSNEGVSFSTKIISDTKKSSNSNTSVSCVSYALIEINSTIYRPQVFTLDGNVHTQALKLSTGAYTLTKFWLMNDNGTSDDYSDDIIMLATPNAGSEFSTFVNRTTGFDFNVEHFKKTSIDIDVVYFTPSDYYKFGFSFDVLPATTIRTQVFMGTFIPKILSDYNSSLYELQSAGLQSEMPAIAKINVFRNGIFVRSYDNEAQNGEATLEVRYPDGNNSYDSFRFDLLVYAKSNQGFDYKYIHSWEFSNDEKIQHEPDGIVHFVLGGNTGTLNSTVLGPYINTPTTSCYYEIEEIWSPGSLNAYFNAEITNVNTGFDISNGTYKSWCGTDSVSINIQHKYEMDIYNSLNPETLPKYTRSKERWSTINWLFNNLSNYPTKQWDDLQAATWFLLNDWNGEGHTHVAYNHTLVMQMVNDAQSHFDFIPIYGQKAAVIYIPKGTPRNATVPKLQVVFIMTYL